MDDVDSSTSKLCPLCCHGNSFMLTWKQLCFYLKLILFYVMSYICSDIVYVSIGMKIWYFNKVLILCLLEFILLLIVSQSDCAIIVLLCFLYKLGTVAMKNGTQELHEIFLNCVFNQVLKGGGIE